MGREIHGYTMWIGFCFDELVSSVYPIQDVQSRHIFDKMVDRDVVSWIILIDELVMRHDLCSMHQCTEHIGIWTHVQNPIQDIQSRHIFDKMVDRDVVSWTILIDELVMRHDLCSMHQCTEHIGIQTHVQNWTRVCNLKCSVQLMPFLLVMDREDGKTGLLCSWH